MANYLLIGGRSTKYLNDFELEMRCFEMLGLKNPTILFVPFAQNTIESISKFKTLTAKYLGKVLYLEDLENEKRIDELFSLADVIYFGGGSIQKLITSVKNSPILKLMNQYKSTDKLYAGISAGAILFCKFGMGDQFTYKDRNHYYNYKMVEGLGFLDITICPHYDHDGLICYNDEVWNYPYDGYALEDDTAILLTPYTKIIKREKSKSVYLFSRENERQMIPLYERVEV